MPDLPSEDYDVDDPDLDDYIFKLLPKKQKKEKNTKEEKASRMLQPQNQNVESKTMVAQLNAILTELKEKTSKETS
eukprot:CAMPEP_0201930522 /NCGR_PEP_ID=MMETSP0903-20130614/25320_1 /ASSEMBLY_ACC=CAM_ASM_000552 /TAXON_ID=420261 /ORGANISM="Thalassiosira antarctica, Strain CCMP982" /LENGTH=75 /DNA_ID=CAMNT_0048469605 /DNA_START=27 /DNA_END=251 /DNA_ORIENTATION=-